MARHEPSALLRGVQFESVPRDRNRAYVVTTWSGIDEGVPVRREQTTRPGAHGAFNAPGYLDARVIGMSGHIIAPTPEQLLNMARRLTGILADGSTARLDLLGEREVHLQVGLAAQTMVTVRGNDPRVADFQIQLWAPNPRMYGEVHDFPGGQVAVNRGNFPARPQLVVSGTAVGGYTVTGPNGRRVVVTKALAAAAPHTIDFATGGLYVAGVRQINAITIYEPWDVPPGLPGVTASVSNGLSLVQRVTDTFV